MLLTLTERHFDQTIGKAHAAPLRHPQVLDRINGRSRITLWLDGRPLVRLAGSVQEVAEQGDGRCHLNLPYERGNLPRDQWCGMLWISLPGDVDPRTLRSGLVVELSEVNAAGAPPRGDEDGPLLIIGSQRSGTTALQTALDAATRYRAPRDVCMHKWNTLEGFFSAQSLWRLVAHPFTSPLGEQSALHGFRTGVFDDSAMADETLTSMARHVDEVFRLAACGSPCWVDKSPGWEPVLLAPLFRALFPDGRIIFMTRRPVSCVLSITRLEGRLSPSLGDPQLVDAIGRNCARWIMAMHLWRWIVEPLIEADARLVVSMEAMQRRERATIKSIGRLLCLSNQEESRFTDALGAAPLARHSPLRDEVDPGAPALVARLTRSEANAWGFEPSAIEASPLFDVVERSHRPCVRLLGQMLEWFGMKQEFIGPRVAAMAGPEPMPPPQASLERLPANSITAADSDEINKEISANNQEAHAAARGEQEEAATALPPPPPPIAPAPGPLLAARLAKIRLATSERGLRDP